jgi:mercuric ion transport protein
MQAKTGKVGLLGSALAALAASTCCLGPLVLIALGISGAWIGHLTALAPYRPIFIGIAVIFLVFAYRQIYRRAATQVCDSGASCASPKTQRLYQLLFWSVAMWVLLAVVFPYLVPYFY